MIHAVYSLKVMCSQLYQLPIN